MTKGRKRTPTHLKVVTGNPGKRPINEDEPKPKNELTDPPAWVDKPAQKYWPYLIELLGEIKGVAKKPDEVAAAAFCEALRDYASAKARLKRDGEYYETYTQTGGKMIRRHPAAAAKKEAMTRLLSLCAEFGLTPASRSRLKVDLGEEEEDPAAKFFSRKRGDAK